MPPAELSVSIPRIFQGGTIEDAFHGTGAESAKGIFSRGFREGAENVMYGPGVYFFEGDYEAAAWWARDRNNVSDPVVIRARVDLGRALYVNLLRREIERLRQGLSQRLERRVTPAQAYAVLAAQLRREDMADTLKAVRVPQDRDERPYQAHRPRSVRAEIVVVAMSAPRATPLEQLAPEELAQTSALGL